MFPVPPRGVRRRLLALSAVVLPSLLLPAAALANVPASPTLSLPVSATKAFGGPATIGIATLRVDYTDAKQTATVTPSKIALGPGNVYTVSSCLQLHVLNVVNDSSCNDKVIDTRDRTAVASYDAPTIAKTANRPAVGVLGGAVFVVSVRLERDGSWQEAATSWPAGGVSKAQIGLAPLGAILGSPLPSQGLALTSTTDTGGVNSGQRDSFCTSDPAVAQTGPGEGISTTALGTGAPAYYEVGEPTGAFAGTQPKGVMLVMNGGGWMLNGSGSVEYDRPIADQWRARGWRTVNLTYRPCSQSVYDVFWFYDRARELWGSNLPYCAHGLSAGGQLALLLANSRPTLGCVVNEAGPVDAATLGGQSAWWSTGPQTNGPRWVYNLMTAAFGSEMLYWRSPTSFPIKARVLMGVAAQDPYTPWAQATELRDKMKANDASAYTDIVKLEAGSVPWTHANVSQAAMDDFARRETELVAPLVSQGT